MQFVFPEVFLQTTDLCPVSAKAVILRGHEVLLLRKPTGKWDLPGGKINPGETLCDGLMREVREEAGLSVSIDDFLGAINRMRPDEGLNKGPLYAFLCSADETLGKKSVALSDEHVAVTFANVWKADRRRMGRSCQRAVHAAQRYLERQMLW